MRTLTHLCRNGHRMAGKNILWHTRYHPVTRAKSWVRECRTCANKRYRDNRKAAKRNRELALAALQAVNAETPLTGRVTGASLCN